MYCILFYFILFYFILFYFILFYFILFYFILFYFILFYFILFYFILFYFILLRLIFWTDWSPIEPRIERATTSGGNRTVIINDPRIVRWPNGVTVDESKKILFWVDAFYDHVVSCDYFGGKISILAPSVHPFGIAVLGDQLYWSDVVNSTIFSRSRHSSSVIQNFGRLSSQGMYAVAVFDSSVQPKGKDEELVAMLQYIYIYK